MYKDFLKRVIDIIISVAVLICLIPFFIAIAVILTCANQGNPFFLQPRLGKNHKPFTIIKFKTMNDKKDNQGNLLPDAKRLTQIGAFIRKTSLDELPQLINVIKGDMSLIGPRPLLVDYLSFYTERQRKRHDLKPGITGWAQVKGRNSIDWNRKFELDVWYLENVSFWLDMNIFWMTLNKVLTREGINQDKQLTMKRFKGNAP